MGWLGWISVPVDYWQLLTRKQLTDWRLTGRRPSGSYPATPIKVKVWLVTLFQAPRGCRVIAEDWANPPHVSECGGST
jgi:hypothetical protein